VRRCPGLRALAGPTAGADVAAHAGPALSQGHAHALQIALCPQELQQERLAHGKCNAAAADFAGSPGLIRPDECQRASGPAAGRILRSLGRLSRPAHCFAGWRKMQICTAHAHALLPVQALLGQPFGRGRDVTNHRCGTSIPGTGAVRVREALGGVFWSERRCSAVGCARYQGPMKHGHAGDVCRRGSLSMGTNRLGGRALKILAALDEFRPGISERREDCSPRCELGQVIRTTPGRASS